MKTIRPFISFLCVASAAIVLASCASGGVTANSKVQVAQMPRLGKTMILLNLESRNFNPELIAGIKDSLRTSYAACGIVAQAFSRDPLDLTPQETLRKAMSDFQPDSVLSATRTGGQVLIGEGGNNANFDVMLRYSTVSPRAEFWTAKADFRVLTANLFTNDRKTGEKIGGQLFELMKRDGVVCSARN